MLTGDNEATARAVANKVGIKEWYADLLPEDEIKIVELLKRKYGRVVMVGDGVNDAPALAIADVGVAMGAIGSYIAIESSDVASMSDELPKLAYLLDLSIKASRRLRAPWPL